MLPAHHFFCLEITGEGVCYPTLTHSGLSGVDYPFCKNLATMSYLRAYASYEDYLQERHDIHTFNCIWPLKSNFLPFDQIDPLCWAKGKKPEIHSDENPPVAAPEPTPELPVDFQQDENPEEKVSTPAPLKGKVGRPRKIAID